MYLMIYAFSISGKMLLFSGEIEPKEYDVIEEAASSIFIKKSDSDTLFIADELKTVLNKAGFDLSPVKIEKVFRPHKK